jgi:hypothetical protein
MRRVCTGTLRANSQGARCGECVHVHYEQTVKEQGGECVQVHYEQTVRGRVATARQDDEAGVYRFRG